MTEQQPVETWRDFEKLPLQPAADILRALGDQLIRSLMAPTPQLSWPTKWDREVPQIWQARRMWRASLVSKWPEVVPFGKKIAKKIERRFVRRLMLGKIKWKGYRKRFAKGLHQELRAETQFGLTPEMWRLAGEAAWIGPDFQLPINRNLDRRLRSEVLLIGGRPPQVFISPQALWVLIALAATQPLKRSERHKMSRQLRRLREPLGRIAADQALRAEWAGFWDQWLLTRALPLVRRRFPIKDAPLLAALKELPLREALGTKALPVPPLPPRFFLARAWWYGRFAFFASKNRIQTFGKKAHRFSQSLADPKWQDELPAWAKQNDLIARNL